MATETTMAPFTLDPSLFTSAERRRRPLKFVFFPHGWVLAHVSRSIEVAKVLRAQGHEVVFAGGDGSHPQSRMYMCTQEGFRVTECVEHDFPYAWNRFLKYGILVAAWDTVMHQRWAPLDTILQSTVDVIERENPDMIVGDGSICTSTAGYITQKPWACILNGYAMSFYQPWKITRHAINLWNKIHLERIRNRVYKKYGVAPKNAIELLWSTRLISPDLREFDHYIDTWQNWESVGPIACSPPCARPKWMDELGDGTTNVYITMGSTGLLDTFLRRNYETLGKLPYRFVVTTGRQATDETVAMAPANFRITDYAPGKEVLANASAMIYHGGNGSMYQALGEGVPMMALPLHLEQELNADLGVKYGFGMRFKPRRIHGQKLVRALTELIDNPSYREAAQRIAPRVLSSSGAERAAELVLEEYAKKRPALRAFSAA